jgi:hypothetical protein
MKCCVDAMSGHRMRILFCRIQSALARAVRETHSDPNPSFEGEGFKLWSPHVFLAWLRDLSRFDSVMSSRAIGEGSVVDRFDSDDHRGFPLGPSFRSLPRASYFSLLVQRKGNQKKAHPVGCARRCAPGPRDSRGFSTRHPCLVEKRAASCRAPCGPDPRIPPQPGVPVNQDQNLRRLTNSIASAVFPRFFSRKRGIASGFKAPCLSPSPSRGGPGWGWVRFTNTTPAIFASRTESCPC